MPSRRGSFATRKRRWRSLRFVAAVALVWSLLAVPASTIVPAPAELHRIAWEYQNAANGRVRDFVRARHLYEEAAAAGYAWSNYGLATIYSRGQGVAVDLQAARIFYEQAAAGGVDRAFFNLGVIYHKGLGVPRDDKRSFEYFSQAAAMGLNHAYFSLGLLYEKGHGVPVNRILARDWYRKAAEAGLPQGAKRLADMKLESCNPILVVGQ
jgi:TPR repeat protein